MYEYSDLNYIDEEDIYEIKNWSEKNCNDVYKLMIKYNNGHVYSDSITCPWCLFNFYIKMFENCDNCEYGKRHGICKKSDSRYRKLLDDGAFVFITPEDYTNMLNKKRRLKCIQKNI